MAIFGASNQLLQIDTGKARTYLFNAALSPIAVYANIGEIQVLGQRYFGLENPTPSQPTTPINPNTGPAVYMLVQYYALSATTTGNLQSAPAPVYWRDSSMTTVTGLQGEGFAAAPNGIAGYMMINTTDVPTLTSQQLLGGTILIQVAGLLRGAISPAGMVAGDWAIGGAAPFTPVRAAQGSAPTARTLGFAATAVAAGLCDMIVDCDII